MRHIVDRVANATGLERGPGSLPKPDPWFFNNDCDLQAPFSRLSPATAAAKFACLVNFRCS